VLLAEGVTSVREAVRTGLGVAVLPNWLIEDDLRSGALVTILPRWKPAEVSVHAVYAGQRVLPARVGAFIDFAVRYLTSEGMDRPYKGGNHARPVR
jgi:DNA-binding transcriptional LysR family regulator